MCRLTAPVESTATCKRLAPRGCVLVVGPGSIHETIGVENQQTPAAVGMDARIDSDRERNYPI